MNASSRFVAAWKLIGLLAILIFIAAAPIPWSLPVPVCVLAVGLFAGIRWSRFVRRLAPILAITAMMAIGGLWSFADSANRRPLEAAARAVVAGIVLVAFGETTSLVEIFRGMSALGVPGLLTSALGLMIRSVDVLADERRALLRSRAARGGEQRSWWGEWRSRAGLVGLLLMRAVDRSEHVHRAMKARGWSAEPNR